MFAGQWWFLNLLAQTVHIASFSFFYIKEDEPSIKTCFNESTDAFPDCPPICPDSYDPVCGTDGKKYENLCKLKLADCDDTETDIQRDPAGTCLEEES